MGIVKNSKAATLLGLHALLGLYSLSDVFSKLASGQDFMSLWFIVFYGLVLVFLGVYALGWQQVIKRMPLSSAYANRAITIIWGIFWGAILFGESITWGKLLGAAIIICGIVLYAKADNADADSNQGNGGASHNTTDASSTQYNTSLDDEQGAAK